MQIDNHTLCRPDAIFPKLNTKSDMPIPKQIWVLIRGYAVGDAFVEPEAVFAWDFKPKTIGDFSQVAIVREEIPLSLIKGLAETGCVDVGPLVYYINRVTLLEK